MKMKNERATRSPIKEDPLRIPGESLREQMIDSAFGQAMLWGFLGGMFLIWAGAEWLSWCLDAPRQPAVMTVIAGPVIIFAIIKWRRAMARIPHLRLGLEGEIAVAETLDELKARGYRVFHDVLGNGYNIDHVVVGPTGVYAIETKTRSKPIRGDAQINYNGKHILVNGYEPDRDPIKQAEASANRVAEILQKATGSRPKVRPVVLYPGWWVNTEAPDPAVWVLNPKRFLGYLRNEPKSLESEDIALLSSAMEIHSRSL